MATSTIWGSKPSLALFRHFIEQVRGLTGFVYGRRMYEGMRYWDEDLAEWVSEEHDFGAVWRSWPKWVVWRTLKLANTTLGPNATLVEDEIETAMLGEIDVAKPDLAVLGSQ
jgi:dihydrofolate reductase